MDRITEIAISEPDIKFTIELKPHVGITQTPLGDFPEELNQWMVYCNSPELSDPLFLGFLPFDPKGKFCPYTTWHKLPAKLQDRVMTQISAATDAEGQGGNRQLGKVPIDPDSEVGRQFLQTGTVPTGGEDSDDEDDTDVIDE